MKIQFCIETDNISGLQILDLDSVELASVPITDELLVGVECVKAEYEYFKIPDNFDGNLAKIWSSENKISEFEALGLRRTLERYVSPHVTITTVK